MTQYWWEQACYIVYCICYLFGHIIIMVPFTCILGLGYKRNYIYLQPEHFCTCLGFLWCAFLWNYIGGIFTGTLNMHMVPINLQITDEHDNLSTCSINAYLVSPKICKLFLLHVHVYQFLINLGSVLNGSNINVFKCPFWCLYSCCKKYMLFTKSLQIKALLTLKYSKN